MDCLRQEKCAKLTSYCNLHLAIVGILGREVQFVGRKFVFMELKDYFCTQKFVNSDKYEIFRYGYKEDHTDSGLSGLEAAG